MSLNAGSGYPNSAQTGCAAGRPHWPAYGGGVAACAVAGHAASTTSVRRTFFTTPALDTRRAARRRPVLRLVYVPRLSKDGEKRPVPGTAFGGTRYLQCL